MTKDEERMHESAANARLVHLNEQLVFPLLQKKIEEQLSTLCESFKTTGEVKINAVAYIAACRDLVTELTSVARHGDRAGEKLGMFKQE